MSQTTMNGENARFEPLGLGLIGMGMASAPHARSLLDLSSDITVKGAFARNADNRRTFCRHYGFPETSSVTDIIGNDDINAVLILTPPNARLDLVKACALAGKHILMEKPIERTVDAAEEIVAMCENAGVKLGIVFQHRFRSGSLRLRQLLEEGALGRITLVRVDVPWWRDQAYYDEPGRGTYQRDGGGVLISQAIHTMDLMLSLAGPVSEVQAVAGTTRLHQMESEDFVAGGMRFANGAMGSIMATTAAYPGAAESIQLDCEKASVLLRSGALDIHWRDGSRETIEGDQQTGSGADPMAFTHAWHRDLIKDFADAVRSGRAPAVTGREALNVHYLIEAFLESARSGQATPVREAQS